MKKAILFLLMFVSIGMIAQPYNPKTAVNYINFQKVPPSASPVTSDYYILLYKDSEKLMYKMPSSILGGIQSVTGNSVDNTDPNNPVVKAIPISGTAVGDPVTGDIEFEGGAWKGIFQLGSEDDNEYKSEIGFDGLYPVIRNTNLINGSVSELRVSPNGFTYSLNDGIDPILLTIDNVTGIGITKDFSNVIHDTDYAQKKYVDDAIAAAAGGTVTSVTGTAGRTTVALGSTTPVINIDAAYDAARDAVANAKVENNLTASTTVAPSKTAVNTALSAKVDTVVLNTPNVLFSTPVNFTTTTGTATGTLALNTQTTNKVLASPNGSTGTPNFRSLVANDIPNIPESQVTNLVTDLAAKEPTITVLPISKGGTGSGTKNFVDLTTTQTVAGLKTLSTGLALSAETASTLVQLDASKQLKSLDPSIYPNPTELSYIKGATGNIPAQITTNTAAIALKQDKAVWVDYSAGSTVTGWASTTIKSIRYIVENKKVTVTYGIVGTSNSATTKFTLPIAAGASATAVLTTGFGQNNGSPLVTPFLCQVNSAGTEAVFYLNFAATAFSASNGKSIYGEFTYEID